MQRRLVSAVLLLAMLLSLFNGSYTSASAAQAVTTVTTDRELAYEPLTQTASIAYEQHEDGYEVSLSRAADSVTMKISAVPADGSGRAPEKARLYIRTGAALKPGTAYRVSFSLWAEYEQPEYAVCFDGASSESAYGTLNGRSIEAGGTDQVQYQVTPETENGELVLRLLLGGTGAAGNTLRLSNLAVDEVSGSEVGTNAVLADNLDYNAPGFIRLWTHTDRTAEVTCDGKSATLNVIKGPKEGAEVWKIKLLVATGLIPTAGKAYRFRVDVGSTAQQSFELCFNDGENEKGYGAEYAQQLTGSPQTLDYIISIPKDKADYGELIIQFSLGKLRTGDKVTISNIALEEATVSYTSMLPSSFSFTTDNTSVSEIDPDIREIGSVNLSPGVDWLSTSFVSKRDDDHRGNTSSLSSSGGEAKLTILELDRDPASWISKLYIQTGFTPERGKSYQVSFDIWGNSPETDWEVNYGKGGDNKDYGALYSGDLPAILPLSSSAPSHVTHTINKLDDNGELWITLCLGKSLNTYWVSNVEIDELESSVNGRDLADVTYPSTSEETPSTPEETPSTSVKASGSFRVRDDHGSIVGDGNSVTMTCEDVSAKYEKGLFIDDICDLSVGNSYLVSFNIEADQDFKYNVCYNRNDHFGNDQEKDFGARYGLDVSSTVSTVEQVITPVDGKGGTLLMFLEFADADTGTKVTVSEIKVQEINIGNFTKKSAIETVNYGTNETDQTRIGSFEVRDTIGRIASNGTSVTMTCEDVAEKFKKGLFIDDICSLTDGNSYLVSFNIEADQDFKYNVCYNRNGQYGDDKRFGAQYNLDVTSAASTVEQIITPVIDKDGSLYIFLEFKEAPDGTHVTVSDVQVLPLEDAASSAGNSGSVVYPEESSSGNPTPAPAPAPVTSPGSFLFRNYEDGSRGILTGDGDSATMTCTGFTNEAWQRGLCVKDICGITAGKTYQVSFDILSNADVDSYNIHFFSDDHESDWNPERPPLSETFDRRAGAFFSLCSACFHQNVSPRNYRLLQLIHEGIRGILKNDE